MAVFGRRLNIIMQKNNPMSKNRFFTLVDNFDFPLSLGYSDKTLFAGSCFSERIGARMQQFKYPVQINPHGVIFNPHSLAASISSVLDNRQLGVEDLESHQGLYLSLQHHSVFNRPDSQEVISGINEATSSAHTFLKNASVIFFTFGTAWAYQHKDSQEIVANCHKIPQQAFDKVLLDLDTMTQQWTTLLKSLRAFNPNLKFVFTVSPVRHWKDGAIENQQSKSALVTLAHRLVHKVEQCLYFPSYEIMVDELRDYRFYDRDLVHPNALAIDIIWERFAERVFSEKDMEIQRLISKLNTALQHRKMQDNKEELKKFKSFGEDTISKIEGLDQSIDLDREKAFFSAL